MGSRLWKQAWTGLLLCASCVHRGAAPKDTAAVVFVAASVDATAQTQAVLVSDRRIFHVGTRESARDLSPDALTLDVESAVWAPPFSAPRVALPASPDGREPADDELLLAPLRDWLRRCIAAGMVEIEAGPMTLRQWQALQTWDALGQVPLRVQAWVDALGHDGDEWLARGPFKGRMVQMKTARFVLTAAALVPEARTALSERVGAFSSAGFRSALVVSDASVLTAVEIFSSKLTIQPGAPTVELELEGPAAIAGAVRPKSAQVTWVLSEAAMRAVALTTAGWLKESRPIKVQLFPAAVVAVSSVMNAAATLLESCADDLPCQAAARAALFVAAPNGQLVAGASADFVALSINPMTASSEELRTGQALLTVVDGVAVVRR